MDETKKQPEEITDAPLPASELDKVVGGDAPKETVTFEYGALHVEYTQQQPSGTLEPKPAPPAK
jgi:hypothetical protein